MKKYLYILLGLSISFMLSCESAVDDDENQNEPLACQGKAINKDPYNTWIIRSFSSSDSIIRDLSLQVGPSKTLIRLSCKSQISGLTASTMALVTSTYSEGSLTLDPTGPIDAKHPRVPCKADEMGGMYATSFKGSCLIMKNQKGTLFFEQGY